VTSNAPSRSARLVSAAAVSLLVALGGFVVVLGAMSLAWRMDLDGPYMMFMPFEWEKFGLVPYRDIFEFNGPGGYFLNWLALKVFGFGDRPFRLADLSYLALLLATTGYALRSLGLAAVAGSLLFGAFYLCQGPLDAFEREYLLLLPLAAALVGVTAASWTPVKRGLWVGACCALAVSIKPWGLIVLPVFTVAVLATAPGQRKLALGATLGGFAIAGGIITGALAACGAAWPLWHTATTYYRLYAAFDGDNHARLGWDAVRYRIHDALAYVLAQKRWAAFAVLGLGCAWLSPNPTANNKRLFLLLPVLATALLVGVAINGKFYDYHWLPVHYCLALMAGLAFLPQRSLPLGAASLAMAAVLIVLTARPSPDILPQWHGLPPMQPALARVDAAVATLRNQLLPGDSLQVLDYSNGGAHIALVLGARSATPFFTDFQFYHNVSTLTIQALRGQFINAFDQAKPRFVLRINGHERAMTGPDTTGEFPALRVIFERR
jgi:hypothetical protein